MSEGNEVVVACYRFIDRLFQSKLYLVKLCEFLSTESKVSIGYLLLPPTSSSTQCYNGESQNLKQSEKRMGRIPWQLTFLYLVLHASTPLCLSTSGRRQDAKTDPPGVLQTLREVLSDFSMDARRYLVSLVGERAVDTSLQVNKQLANLFFRFRLLGLVVGTRKNVALSARCNMSCLG